MATTQELTTRQQRLVKLHSEHINSVYIIINL